MSTNGSDEAVGRQAELLLRLADSSAVQRRGLRLISELTGPTEGRSCVLVTGGSTGLALHLCESPGTWQSLHRDEAGAALFRARFGNQVEVIDKPRLPLADDFADVVVVYGYLEYERDTRGFIEECNRILKEGGHLVVHVPRAKPWSVARGLQRVLGLRRESKTYPARRYTPTQLFDEVKDGFDVNEERTYSRFFVEVMESLVEVVASLSVRGMRRRAREVGMSEENAAVTDRLCNVHSVCYPLLVLAGLLDGLLFFTAGYYMVCSGRQRMWRPRRTPVLKDGRSIADAAINTKIGTASPF